MSEPQTPHREPFDNLPESEGLDDQGAARDQQTIDLAHALFDLARQGRTEQLAAYVDAGAPANLADPAGNTLLMLAAYHGHADLVRELARRGADVDRLNDRGQSPLAGAVFKGEQDVIDALLEHGADPDAGTPTARESAQIFGRPDLFGGSGQAGSSASSDQPPRPPGGPPES